MSQIDVKREVERAIAAEWQRFAEAHPALAAALDQAVLVETAMSRLSEDPEFQAVLRKAQAAGSLITCVSWISEFVGRWLWKL